MKLRTKKLEKWISVKDQNDNEAEFLISPMTPKETTSLLKKFTKKEVKQGQVMDDIDFYGFKIARLDAVLKDWKNIENEDGSPMVCSRITKETVYNYNPEIIDEVLKQADEIGESLELVRTDEEKNLKAL